MDDSPTDYFVTRQQFTPTVYRDVYPAIDPTQASLSQKGKVVIVTGASQGIGARAFVASFAAAGAKAVVLVARSADKLKEVADNVAKQYPDVETLVVPTDIADPASVTALFKKVKETYGHADVLVNNASIFKTVAPIKDVDQQAWWDDMTINIRGTFLVTQSFLSALPSPTTPAKIITLTSGVAYEVFPNVSAYSLSKLADFQLTTFVAVENPNVVAVALHPGIVDTDMVVDMFKRFALDTPALVGGVAVWLAAWEDGDKGRDFLSGRFVSANWDVDELVERKQEILEKGLLKMNITAKLGASQFGQ